MPEWACILLGLANAARVRPEAGYGHLGPAPRLMFLLYPFFGPAFIFRWFPLAALSARHRLAYQPGFRPTGGETTSKHSTRVS